MMVSAQVAIAGINFVCGFILVIGSYVMEGLEETREAQKWLVHLFRCVPPFNLGALRHAEARHDVDIVKIASC